jgi:hypothetical protein
MADEIAANSTTPPSMPTAPGSSVNVTAPAPDPIETQASPQQTQMIAQPDAAPSGPAPIAAAAATPPVKGDNLAVRVYHGIMGALGGTQDTSYQRDPQTGKMVVTQTPSGPGTQWKRMIAGVVQGTAAGLSVPPGPGQLSRAAGAGITAGSQGAEQQQQQGRDRADQDYNVQQQALVRKAQTQALTYQSAVSAFQLSRMQVDAKVQDSDRENAFVKLINNGGNGSQDLGVAQNFDNVLQMHKDMPNLMKENAQGNIVTVPHINSDGKFDGTRFALVTPQWKDAKIDTDQGFFTLKPPTKIGDEPEIVKQTVKAGTMTNGDYINRQTAAGNEILKWQTENNKVAHQERVDNSAIAKNAAEAAKDYALAAKAKAESGLILNPEGMGDNEIVKGMIDGTVDISKVASIRGNRREQYIEAAKRADPNFNMQDYQLKLATRKSFTGDGKNAIAIQSFNQFLGHTMDLSQSINAMRSSNIPLMNKSMRVLKQKFGSNPAVKDLIVQQSAAKTEFQNFLNNNHALLAQDKEEGEKMLNEDMSPADMQSVAKQFVATAAIRMSAVNSTFRRVIGTDVPNMLDEDGKAALQHFGVPESMVYHHPTGVASKPQAAPAGAQNEVHDAQGKLIGHTVNNRYVALGQ